MCVYQSLDDTARLIIRYVTPCEDYAINVCIVCTTMCTTLGLSSLSIVIATHSRSFTSITINQKRLSYHNIFTAGDFIFLGTMPVISDSITSCPMFGINCLFVHITYTISFTKIKTLAIESYMTNLE